jgi:hypothetical protein
MATRPFHPPPLAGAGCGAAGIGLVEKGFSVAGAALGRALAAERDFAALFLVTDFGMQPPLPSVNWLDCRFSFRIIGEARF